MQYVAILMCAVAAYLLASISSAILICKLFRAPDPRSQGSGNPGTTNVLRVAGKLPAALTLLFDALKGLLPVALAAWSFSDPVVVSLIYLVAIVGHVFPVYYKFKGGKGIATAIGGLFGMYWPLGLCFATIWLFMAFMFRYSSLAALVAIGLSPVYVALIYSPQALGAVLIAASIAVLRHKENIKRLVMGEESKIKLKRSQSREGPTG